MLKQIPIKTVLYFFVILSFTSYPQTKHLETLYQTAPIISLMKGVMNDNISIGELKKHGNFGLGTFNGVDGEMIVLNGKVYRVNHLGKVNQPSNSVKTPFAAVVSFAANKTITSSNSLNFDKLKKLINKNLPSENSIYAIKVTGSFNFVNTRSEPKQIKSYSNLGAVLKNQDVFHLKNVSGTMVGFIFPKYLSNVNAEGYHFHFINDDRNAGGHVLDFSSKKLKIEIEFINNLDLRMPDTAEFDKAKLN